MVSNSSSGNNSDQLASEHYQETDSYVADETYSHEMITDQPSINKLGKIPQIRSVSVQFSDDGIIRLYRFGNGNQSNSES